MLISVRDIWVMFSTRTLNIKITVMVQPKLEVVYICNVLIGERGKGVPNLKIHSYMIIIRTTPIASRG